MISEVGGAFPFILQVLERLLYCRSTSVWFISLGFLLTGLVQRHEELSPYWATCLLCFGWRVWLWTHKWTEQSVWLLWVQTRLPCTADSWSFWKVIPVSIRITITRSSKRRNKLVLYWTLSGWKISSRSDNFVTVNSTKTVGHFLLVSELVGC